MPLSASSPTTRKKPPPVTAISDADRCLLSDAEVLALSGADAAGYLERRSNMSGWYRYWFTLRRSQLMFFERPADRRTMLVDSICLFRHKLVVINSPKRRREFELAEFSTGKIYTFRTDSDPELHWWLHLFEKAKFITPPAKPIHHPQLSAKSNSTATSAINGSNHNSNSHSNSSNSNSHHSNNGGTGNGTIASLVGGTSSNRNSMTKSGGNIFNNHSDSALTDSVNGVNAISPRQRGKSKTETATDSMDSLPSGIAGTSTNVNSHLPINHVLCVVHGIGVDEDGVNNNVKQLQESYLEIMGKIYPDINFEVQILPVHWRNTLLKLDIHKKLKSVVPKSPYTYNNPLKDMIEYRVIDYIYYTHSRYKLYILREICKQLNYQVSKFYHDNPDYDGNISIIGHSLGACLVYELLMKNLFDDQILLKNEYLKLNFSVDHFFSLGSPLSTLLLMDPLLNSSQGLMFNHHAPGLTARATHEHPAGSLSLPFQLTNIFKFQDPIATRIEPFIHDDWAERSPVIVPCWTNAGIRGSTTEWFGSLWPGSGDAKDGANGAATATATADETRGGENGETESGREIVLDKEKEKEKGEEDEDEDNEEAGDVKKKKKGGVDEEMMKKTLGGRRLDYGLQISSTMEEMSSSWSAVKSHTEYWGNRDAMLLMVSQMLKSSCGLCSKEQLNDTEGVIVTEQSAVHRMFGMEKQQRCADADNKARQQADEVVTIVSNKKNKEREEDVATVQEAVKGCVERMVDEAVATYELTRQHPGVRVGSAGGVGQKLILNAVNTSYGTKAQQGQGHAQGQGQGVDEGGNASTKSKQKSKDGANNGWASYILNRGWFGGSGSGSGTALSVTQTGVASESNEVPR